MNPDPTRPALCGAAALLAVALLAGCGGGGGGGGSADTGGEPQTGGNPTPEPQSPQPAPQSPQPAPPPPEPTVAQQLDRAAAVHRARAGFRAQPALAVINADRAYARLELEDRGEPGQGVVIGMIDTLVDFTHQAFPDPTQESVRLEGIGTDESRHGTNVASTIAAQRDWFIRTRDEDTGELRRVDGAHGVAYAARLRAFALDLRSPNPGDGYQPNSPGQLAGADASFADHFTQALDAANQPGAGFDMLNLSFGLQGIIENYREEDLRARAPQTLAALAQADRPKKTLLVWAAGNAHGLDCLRSATDPLCVGGGTGGSADGTIDARSPEILPGLMARIPELRPHSVAVVGVNESGTIHRRSNRCGIAADWCLAAPYYVENVAYSERLNGRGRTGVADATGTSFSAPMVTGGLALMKQYFRGQLSNEQLLARMLATADKSGRYADAAVYGQGLLDLGAAVSPVGSSTLAAGARVGGAGADVRHTRLESGAALGDGMARSLRGREAAAFDELGAPFWHDLGAFAPRAEAADAGAALRDFMAAEPAEPAEPGGPGWTAPGGTAMRYSARLLQPAAAAPGDHLALAGRAVSLRAERPDGWSADFFATDDDAAAPARGAVLAWRPRERDSGPRLRAGWMAERATLLGSRAEGAFGALRGDLVFGGAGGSLRAGAWTLSADAELGAAAPETGGGLIEDIPRLVTSAFRLRAERPAAGGAWRVSLAQPLRVENGEAVLSVPVGRTPEGDVLRRRLAADLEPSGRQLDLSTRWRQPLAGGELRLGSVWTRHPGHRADASSEWTLLAGWRADF